MIPAIVKITNAFAWSYVDTGLLYVLGTPTDELQLYETPGDSATELLLQVAELVESEEAQQALLKEASTKELALHTVKMVDIFWKRIIVPGDAQTFKQMADKIENVNPRELGPFVEVFSKYIDNHDTDKSAVLETSAARRMDWLEGEIKRLEQVDKTFSWKMPFADDWDPAIDPFLRGPEESMTTEGVPKFNNLRDAKKFARKSNWSQCEASFKMEAGETNVPFVTITKTRKWYDDTQIKLARYEEELAQLSERFRLKKYRSDKSQGGGQCGQALPVIKSSGPVG
ncbi:unnamed protein product [Phytophthora fragariaefolia]|uniref:Unnamed protein product n=1 Tax=Phytophthora fragariaefolia TaxID=1490495 RepID=A0A9W6XXJ9_9STRA|nr:unnamed protein product [Phytophthora fragariaefolia]